MLAALRAFAKSPIAAVFMTVVTMSFVFVGVRDVLHPKFSNAVVTAGSHETSPAAFKRSFGILLQRFEQEANQEITIPDAIDDGLDQRVLSMVESQSALSEYLSRAGVRPSNYLVTVDLNTAPAFVNALGQFDQTLFNQWLGENGLNAEEVREESRDDLALKHTVAALAAGLQTPKSYGATIASYNFESRAISFFVINQHSVPPPAQPTDAQLQALITQHADELMRPEMRVLTVVHFSARQLAPSMTADPAAIQALYDKAKDKLAQPEKRSLVEFATHDAGKAQQLLARLKAGDAPDAIAKALGVPAITYDDKSKDDVVDPQVASAAFAAKTGDVIGPIASTLAGYAVVKVGKITPAATPTLEQLRPQLEALAKTNAAIKKNYDAVQKYSAAHDSGSSLADAARGAGETPVSVGPVGENGRDVTGQPVQTASAKLLKAAFALAPGAESDVVDDGEGEYFAVRVDKVLPPALPTLADIRPRLTQAYMQNALMTAMQAKADALVAAIKKGESLAAAAASVQAKVGQAPTVTRAALAQSKQMDANLVEALFQAKQGDVLDGPVGQGQFLVVHIDAAHPAVLADAAKAAAYGSRSFNQTIGQDMLEAARAYAVDKIRPEGDIGQARQALGVSSDQTQSSAPKKAKKGPAL